MSITEANGKNIMDFYRYLPTREYICSPTGALWCNAGVDATLDKIEGVKATAWLDMNRTVDQLTWAPGEPEFIEDRILDQGGWKDRDDYNMFNQYHGPDLHDGDPTKADRWIEHCYKVYPTDAEHQIKWFAFKVQNPGVKVNHCLVLGGAPGIGKDTLLAPVRHAVGVWNFRDVEPRQLLGRFNGYQKAVLIRASEAHDLGDMNRYQFYDHTKILIAAPPELLRVDEKNIGEYYIPNVCGLIITTNHRTDGLYLPPDDRRHHIGWSEATQADFDMAYWHGLWGWYAAGGYGHVAALLASYDLEGFDPGADPPKTSAFWDIVSANSPPETGDLADVLDLMGWPDALCPSELTVRAPDDLRDWLKDRSNRKALPHRLADNGYAQVRNPNGTDGLWRIMGRRQAAYAKAALTPDARLAAVQRIR